MRNIFKKLFLPLVKKQRRFLRISQYHLIKYKVVEAKKESISFAKDVGGGGIRVCLPEGVPAGSIVELEINFPFLPQPVKAKARAVWSNFLKKTKKYEIGFKFIDIDPKICRIINKRISQAKTLDRKISLKVFILFLIIILLVVFLLLDY